MANRIQRHIKICAMHCGTHPLVPVPKRKPWKPADAERASPSGIRLPRRAANRPRGNPPTVGVGGREAGKSGNVQDLLRDYPPPGEVQLRGVHSNARSLVKLR